MTLRYGSNLGLLAGGDPGEQHYQALLQQWRGLDALVQPSVISRVATLPTANLVDGDRYLLTSGGNSNKIARYSTDLSPAGWEYFTPKNGWTVWSTADQQLFIYKGGALTWQLDTAGIERGSNANGDYVRFPDGTMICTISFVGYQAGVLKNVPLPATFAIIGDGYVPVSGGIIPFGGYDFNWNAYARESHLLFISQITDPQNKAVLVAIGRWK